MPSFRDNIQPNEAWDLVHYLRTLQLKLRHKPLSPQDLEAKVRK
jgi:hypothetical protein